MWVLQKCIPKNLVTQATCRNETTSISKMHFTFYQNLVSHFRTKKRTCQKLWQLIRTIYAVIKATNAVIRDELLKTVKKKSWTRCQIVMKKMWKIRQVEYEPEGVKRRCEILIFHCNVNKRAALREKKAALPGSLHLPKLPYLVCLPLPQSKQSLSISLFKFHPNSQSFHQLKNSPA